MVGAFLSCRHQNPSLPGLCRECLEQGPADDLAQAHRTPSHGIPIGPPDPHGRLLQVHLRWIAHAKPLNLAKVPLLTGEI